MPFIYSFDMLPVALRAYIYFKFDGAGFVFSPEGGDPSRMKDVVAIYLYLTGSVATNGSIRLGIRRPTE